MPCIDRSSLSLTSRLERVTVSNAPFQVGERVRRDQLVAWTYAGLSGKPDKDKDAVRRFKKGEWVLEVRAYGDRTRPARVLSIRTTVQDDQHWKAARQRRT